MALSFLQKAIIDENSGYNIYTQLKKKKTCLSSYPQWKNYFGYVNLDRKKEARTTSRKNKKKKR